MREFFFCLLTILCARDNLLAGKIFDVRLLIDYESAEESIALFSGLSGSPSAIAGLRGSSIAMATTELLDRRRLTRDDLERALQAAKFNQILSDDVFRLREGREHAGELQELLDALKRRNFAGRVVSTVGQLFPESTKIRTSIPVFFVAFGHQNVAAFVRRVVWEGDSPRFVGEGQGELTIVVNLTKAIYQGRTVDEQFVALLSTVAHEVFHAAFGVYKDGSPSWRSFYAGRRGFLDQLIDLTHNEGIAHYLSLIQRTGGKLRQDEVVKVNAAFLEFNRTADILMSNKVSQQRAQELILNSNSSGYWESYGAITGMIIARQIDQSLGRLALMETIERGPYDFFGKYLELARRDNTIPPLGNAVREWVSEH